MSRVPVRGTRPRTGLADTLDDVQPDTLASLGSLAPSLASRALGGGVGPAAAAAAGESSAMARSGIDAFSSTPYGQLGVTAFTEGIYTEEGHINPMFSDALTESTGRMMTELVGEQTMEKMEQKMARAVDKITDVELSAGQIAMVAGAVDYLPEESEEGLVHEDVPDVGEMPDHFTTPMDEPPVDMQELNVGELGRMGGPTDEYIPQMEDAGDVETDGCCCCCGEDGGDDLCGCGDLCDMCGCGGCCGCGGLLDCCDCGDCFGCGDCIGCADCSGCCSFDCSIM